MNLRELTDTELTAFEISREVEELTLLEAERIKGIVQGYKIAKNEFTKKEVESCN